MCGYGGGDEWRSKVRDGPEVPHRLSVSWWEEKWDMKQTSWKRAEAGDLLPFPSNVAWLEKSTGKKVLVKGRRAFVPLCGDSKVVVWLAKQGLEVTALEGAPLALTSLRAKVAEEPADVQARITIVDEDLFEWGKVERPAPEAFDFVYDRGSFVAIDPARRKEYTGIIERVTHAGSLCYLEGIMRSPIYKGKQVGAQPPSCHEHAPWLKVPNMACGPPHNTPASKLQDFYGADAWEVKVDEDSMKALLDRLSDPQMAHGHYRTSLSRI